MLAPSWLCKAVYRIHPQLRLAWVGRDRKYEDELNAGSFALVQLFHIRDLGLDDASLQYKTRWDIEFVADEWGNSEGTRIRRGPVFSKNGTCTPDWDPLFRKPMYIANLEDYGIPLSEVLSGEFLGTVKEWLTPIKRRVIESAKEQGKLLKTKAEDIGDEAADFLWREAQRSDATSVIKANKHCKEEMATFEKAKQAAAQLPSYYMPPEN